MSHISLQCSICQMGFDNEHPPYILVHQGTQGCAANFHQPCARLWTRGCPNCRTQYTGMQKNFALLHVLNEIAASRAVPASPDIPSHVLSETSSAGVVASRTLRARQQIAYLAQEHQLHSIEDPRRRRAALRSIHMTFAARPNAQREPDPEPRIQRTMSDTTQTKPNFFFQIYISSDKFTSMDPKVLAKDLAATLDEIPEAGFIVVYDHMGEIIEEHTCLTKICKGPNYNRSLIKDKGLAAMVEKFHPYFKSHFLETDFLKIVAYVTKYRADQLNKSQQQLVCRGYIEYLTHR